MNRLIRRILWFTLMVALQVVIGNRIHLFGLATPFICIYFVLTLDHDISRNALLFWAFALGLTVDIFSNTLGMHAAACTLVALVRPHLLHLFFTRDESEVYEPGIKAMGVGGFWPYALTSILLHHSVFYLLEFFSFSLVVPMLLHIVCSTVLTLLLILALELIRSVK